LVGWLVGWLGSLDGGFVGCVVLFVVRCSLFVVALSLTHTLSLLPTDYAVSCEL